MPTYAIGIDPGKKGAVACVGPDGFAEAHAGSTNDYAWIDEILTSLAASAPGTFIAAVEKVGAGGGDTGEKSDRRMSPRSAFSFGGGFLAPQAVLYCHRIPQVLVTPQKWQRIVGNLGSTKGQERKERIRAAARARWPGVDMAAKGKGQAKADALFLALYAMREMA